MVAAINTGPSIDPMSTTNEETRRQSFAQALKNKYVNQELFDNKFIVPKDRKISTDIIFVGFHEVSNIQRQLKGLTNIDLSKKGIAYAGDLDELEDNLNRVQVLNLACNELSWKEVVQILLCVPNLKELVLSANNLTTSSSEDFLNVPPNLFRKLSSMTLGQTCSNWAFITRTLSQLWPTVDQLDLWGSNLTGEDMVLEESNDLKFIRGLRILKLSQNSFPNLDWIHQLGPTENLLELDLSHCGVKKLDLQVIKSQQLRNLHHLNISYNGIDDWPSISHLHLLENLSHLICHQNPLFSRDKHVKELIIGRLGRIKMLNREEVTREVRRDSEILYLRKTFAELLVTPMDNSNLVLVHPRYYELAELYGLPQNPSNQSNVDKYVTVNLVYKDNEMSKKVPCDMKVASIKMLCKRLFRIKPLNPIRITCVDSKDGALSYDLDKDEQSLHYFSVKNGGKLEIRDVDSE